MNKNLVLLFVFIFIFFTGVLFFKEKNLSKNKYTIGILQFASFPQLDAAQIIFKKKMKKEFGNNITFIEQNAQGSLTQAHAIAASFQANSSIDAFYAIATPSVQALKVKIKDKPIVFAAVTDPEGLYLRDKGTNITGATDMANIKKQISILKKLLPNMKRVSLLYTAGEPNSVSLINKMKKELDSHSISFREFGINSINETAISAQSSVKNSDLILIPTDSNLTTAFPIVKQIASRANVPVAITWTGERGGALLQFGVDYFESGSQAADIMKQVLIKGTHPSKIPIAIPKSEIIIDLKLVEKFKIKIPESIKDFVTFL